ncbi:MAG: nagA 5 [Planctomycetaceae bacterium]|nr:nagA 5 [Planctomycetaceae bacterium]
MADQIRGRILSQSNPDLNAPMKNTSDTSTATNSRREFLRSTTLAAASGLAISSHIAQAAEEKKPPVRIAVMGLNGRGKGLLNGFCAFPEVEVAYLCDPDSKTIPEALKVVAGKGKPVPKVVTDFREALADKQVTALVCAAPDHWHALATVWSCQAGKDVYVEKPVSHNIREGQTMVAAARKFQRVVQAGTQRRSASDLIEAVKLIREGKLGDVKMVRTWITSERPQIGKLQPSAPPENLDFNLWAGPGPGDVYKSNLVHYHWHWRWDYGTGECGNNGIHAMDVARWGLGVEYPDVVTCGGGKYFFDDDQETPDTQLATFDFPNACLQWEHRTWTKRGIDGQTYGVEFYGTEATLLVSSKGWRMFKDEKEIQKHDGSDMESAHIKNFLDCLVSREKPNGDIEIAHRSTQLCHLANIAWRTRSTVKFDGVKGEIIDNPAAAALMGRTYRKGFELPVV